MSLISCQLCTFVDVHNKYQSMSLLCIMQFHHTGMRSSIADLGHQIASKGLKKYLRYKNGGILAILTIMTLTRHLQYARVLGSSRDRQARRTLYRVLSTSYVAKPNGQNTVSVTEYGDTVVARLLPIYSERARKVAILLHRVSLLVFSTSCLFLYLFLYLSCG